MRNAEGSGLRAERIRDDVRFRGTRKPTREVRAGLALRALPFRLLEGFGDLERASYRFLCAVLEDQGHSIAGWQPNELFISRFPHWPSRQYHVSKPVQPLLLILVQEFRVTDDVDEQDMPDL